jgi:hypothetical protein
MNAKNARLDLLYIPILEKASSPVASEHNLNLSKFEVKYRKFTRVYW